MPRTYPGHFLFIDFVSLSGKPKILKMYFFLKLNPPRPDFAGTMSEDEKAIMHKHIEYCNNYMSAGKLITFGPVLDPAGVYGVGILSVLDEKEVIDFINNDPASGINRYEYHVMMAVVKPS
jgi:uncharacterized protein YciI